MKYKVDVQVEWNLVLEVELDEDWLTGDEDEAEIQRMLEMEARDHDDWARAFASAGPPSDVQVNDWDRVPAAPSPEGGE